MTEIRKSFKELSEYITEEEYRNNGRFHYSDIAGYMKNGFQNLISPKKEESESLTFGSLVDTIVTEGTDAFFEKYCIGKEFNLSDNQKFVIRSLVNTGKTNIEDIESDIVLETLGIYYKNPKSQFTKLLEDGSEYYKFLVENQGKTAVDAQMFNDAAEVSTKLLTSDNTAHLLLEQRDGLDRFFQLKFNGEIENIPVTCMVDMILVDHNAKTIWPFDLKTTCAEYEWEFPKAFVKWRYDVQAKLYSTILRQVMADDDFYKEYRLLDFTFIYISRHNKYPLLWTFGDCLGSDDIVIERKNGTKLILNDFRKPLKEMQRYSETRQSVPNGIFGYTYNDILEHLKES